MKHKEYSIVDTYLNFTQLGSYRLVHYVPGDYLVYSDPIHGLITTIFCVSFDT